MYNPFVFDLCDDFSLVDSVKTQNAVTNSF